MKLPDIERKIGQAHADEIFDAIGRAATSGDNRDAYKDVLEEIEKVLNKYDPYDVADDGEMPQMSFDIDSFDATDLEDQKLARKLKKFLVENGIHHTV